MTTLGQMHSGKMLHDLRVDMSVTPGQLGKMIGLTAIQVLELETHRHRIIEPTVSSFERTMLRRQAIDILSKMAKAEADIIRYGDASGDII